MDKKLLMAFFNCGDGQIIEFALQRARLNRRERDVITFIIEECMTQEETAEIMGYSVRQIQNYWYSASTKMLNIAWVRAYAYALI